MKIRISGNIEGRTLNASTYDIDFVIELPDALAIVGPDLDEGKATPISEAMMHAATTGFPDFRFNDPDVIEVVVKEAAKDGHPLSFNYVDGEGTRSFRKVVPHEVFTPIASPQRPIASCYDLDKMEKRSFRLDRMSNVGRLD